MRTEKGAVAVPADFIEVSQFPETRSGKYMRRMVRALVEGGELGDVTTLRNPESLAELKTAIDAWQRQQRLSEEQALFEELEKEMNPAKTEPASAGKTPARTPAEKAPVVAAEPPPVPGSPAKVKERQAELG